ncbi:hypothetical protein HMPREF1985_01687 [Mitsuokella sp. oral taxon 131 str. W9106]|nr:hypothetical protein HMPREF1985_01687 [Mitsuokella sp. oral taxon 131 str. W9106]
MTCAFRRVHSTKRQWPSHLEPLLFHFGMGSIAWRENYGKITLNLQILDL